MVTLLKTTTDKYGNILKIYHSHTLSNCKAVSLMLKCYAELIDKNYHNGDNSLYFDKHHEIVWVECDENAIGGLYYKIIQEKNISWSTFGFAEPTQRGSGAIYACHYAQEEYLKTKGIYKMQGLISFTNTPSINFSKNFGYTLENSIYDGMYLATKELKPVI